MGDATFTKPIARWLEKRRAKKAAKAAAQEMGQADDLASVRDIFELSQRDQPEVAAEPGPSEVSEEPAEVNELDLDLVQNVFTRTPAPEQHAPEFQTTEGGIGRSPEPSISRVRVDPLDEEDGGEPQALAATIADDETTEAEIDEATGAIKPAVRPLQKAVVRDADQDGGERLPAARPLGATTPEAPEGQTRVRPASGEVLDSLPVSLKDIFRKKTATNPQVKALLQRHGKVDATELAADASDLTSKLAASEEQE